MRLIDADALILHLSDYQLQEAPAWGANGYGNADKYEAITDCIRAIEEAPIIEPERKTGKWKPWKAYYGKDHKSWSDELKCSVCGYQWGDEEYKFCPMCGATMEEQ